MPTVDGRRRPLIRCEPLASRLLLAAGDPDFSFSQDGRAALSFPGAPFVIADTAVAPDGKVVVAGKKGSNMAVARLNADGTLDTSFGTGGLFESGRHTEVTSVAVQGDGKIIVGLGEASDTNGPSFDLHLGRLRADGVDFDNTFGVGGVAIVSDDSNDFYASSIVDVAIQRDGKIVGAGHVNTELGGDDDFAVVRYNANGTVDNTFGGGDAVAQHGFGGFERITSVTIDYNDNPTTNPLYGTIVAVGGLSTRFLLMRLRPSGLPDSSFAGDGLLISPEVSGAGGEHAIDVAVQPGGKIVVAGTAITSVESARNILVARYTAQGELDDTFGLAGGGVTELDLGNSRDEAGAIAVGFHAEVGNFVVAGSRNGRMVLVALRPNGQLDTRFSADGILDTGMPGQGTGLFATGSLFQPQRKLVIAGGSGEVGRFVDVGSVITVGTLQPQMFEQGQQPTNFVVARDVRLPFQETILLSTSGGVTTLGPNRDLNGQNIIFGNGLTTQTRVVIPTDATFVEVTLTPIDDALVEGDETIRFTAGTTLTYDAGTPNNATLVVRDNDNPGGPVITAAAFAFETAPQRVSFTFSQNVAASISAADFQLTGPAGMPPSTFSYDQVTNTATLSFTALLPDGDYTARAIAAGITNASGQPLPADHVLDFFFLSADANRDRAVNLQDFNRLAANFGQSGRTFSQGDFNYDDQVNLVDFNILAGRFGAAIAPSARPVAPEGPDDEGEPPLV
jgi:uncharacterized delta-60 repeat protein